MIVLAFFFHFIILFYKFYFIYALFLVPFFFFLSKSVVLFDYSSCDLVIKMTTKDSLVLGQQILHFLRKME